MVPLILSHGTADSDLSGRKGLSKSASRKKINTHWLSQAANVTAKSPNLDPTKFKGEAIALRGRTHTWKVPHGATRSRCPAPGSRAAAGPTSLQDRTALSADKRHL